MRIAAYLTGGFPDLASLPGLVRSVGAEADVLEVGLPFADPMADGLTIQRASRAALARGATARGILDALARMGERPAAPLYVMSYLNPLLALGLPSLPERLLAAGVSGLVVPDLPLEEAAPLDAALAPAGLHRIRLVTPMTPPPRVERIVSDAPGWVYAVTRAGTTGTALSVDRSVGDYLDRVRAIAPVPVLAGFGVRTPEQVRALAAHADGVVVGSALVEAIERAEDPGGLVRSLKEAA